MVSPPFSHQHASGYRQSFVSLVFCIQCCCFFLSKPKQRFPTEHLRTVPTHVMVYLHDDAYISSYIISITSHSPVDMSFCVIVIQYCTAWVYGMMGNEVQLKSIFTSESWQKQTWQLALTESVCRDVTGSLVLVTFIPRCQCLGYVNATKPCMFLCFIVYTSSLRLMNNTIISHLYLKPKRYRRN